MTRQYVVAWRVIVNEMTKFLSTSTGEKDMHRFLVTVRLISVASHATGFLHRESHISKSRAIYHPGATPMLTKLHALIAVLEWPIEAAGQGAASLPSEPCQER